MRKESPRIYYRCPDHDIPYGGVKVIYEHVDILNGHGYDAAVLHDGRDFRCTWFENRTKVTSVEDIRIYKEDILVFPEVHAKYYLDLAKGINYEDGLIKKLKKNDQKNDRQRQQFGC